MWLFVAFLAVPLIEIALFIQVGGWLGLWPTLGIVILTAVLGTWLVRSQGQLAMNNLRHSFSNLDDPSRPLADGAMILVAGALLLTPGFFTDAVGFAFLTPQVRHWVYKKIRDRVHVAQFEMGQQQGHSGARPRARDTVIDADYVDVSPDKPTDGKGSGWTRP